MSLEIKETFQKELVKAHYDLDIGPPLLEFEAADKGIAQPLCSVKMLDYSPRSNSPGLCGKLQGNPILIPATTPVTFDPKKEETQHVLLAFELTKDLTVEAYPEQEDPENEEEMASTSLAFQKAFKEYFTKPADSEKRPSLSYSIASVSKKPDSRAPELRPETFQFATFYREEKSDSSLLSVFLQVEGGPKAGQKKKLQERWTSQWVNNDLSPVPDGFSASLMLSSALFNAVILKNGFLSSSWSVEEDSPKNEAFNRILFRNLGTFDIPEQNHDWGWTNIFHIDGAQIPLENFPLTLTIRQDDPLEAPNIYGLWDIRHTLGYPNTYKLVGLGPRVRGAHGEIEGQWHLCHEVDHTQPRRLTMEMKITDEAFKLEFQLNTREVFRFDQPEESALDWETWKKGMTNLWFQAADVSIFSSDIGFLRTTNLLLPGKHVIDIDENIGIRAPKDIIFFGDMIKG